MAVQQGLFTQGPSVDDILAKRNQRSADMQQQLMNQAAQGARDPAKMRAVSLLGSSLGRALAGSMGGQDKQIDDLKAKNAAQADLQKRFGQELMTGTPESNIAMGGELIQMGYVDKGGQLLKKGQTDQATKAAKQAATLKEQQRREALIRAATNLKLDSTIELLNNGGDMDEAADQIRSQEEIKIADQKGRAGKLALSAKYNKGKEWAERVKSGEFDSMDSTLFVDMLKGVEADLKPFKNADGKTEFLRVDNSGRVFNPKTQTWVEASELKLSVAPQLTQEVEQMDYITRSLVDTELKTYGEVHTKATDAQRLLELNYVSQDMLDKGLISGKMGEFSLQTRKLLGAMGLSSDEMDSMVGNTEAFFAFRGRAVAEIIKAFGAGTGLSDKDREYAAKIAGGEITLEPQSIQNLLELERKYASMAIAKNNSVVDRLVAITGNDQWKNSTDFYLEAPVRPQMETTPQEPQATQISAEAQAILDRINPSR